MEAKPTQQNFKTITSPNFKINFIFKVVNKFLVKLIFIKGNPCIKPGGSYGKEPTWPKRSGFTIPESGKSPGEGNGNPPQYSCLENPMERGAWRAAVHGATQSRTRLSDLHSVLSRAQRGATGVRADSGDLGRELWTFWEVWRISGSIYLPKWGNVSAPQLVCLHTNQTLPMKNGAYIKGCPAGRCKW